jgi:hypothetical protein
VLIGDRHRVEIRVIAVEDVGTHPFRTVPPKPRVVARASDQRAIDEVTRLLATLEMCIPARRVPLEDIRRAVEMARIDPLLEKRVDNHSEWGTCDFVDIPCDLDWCDFDLPCDGAACDGCDLGCDI